MSIAGISILRIMAIYDAGEKVFERYTVYYNTIGTRTGHYEGLAMSEHPFNPQGFGQHITGQLGRHNGRKIKFSQLPPDCQQAVRQDFAPAPVRMWGK